MIKCGRFRFSQMLLYLVGLMLCSNLGIPGTGLQYAIAASIVALFFVSFRYKKIRLIQNINILDLFPALMIFTWLYGITVGFICGNNPVYVMSNFAGLALYILYYPMVFLNLDKNKLIKLVYFCVVVNFIYAIVTSWGVEVDQSAVEDGVEGISGTRRYYSAGLLVFFPGLSLILTHYFVKSLGVRFLLLDIIYIIAALTCFLYLSASKGFLAALLTLIAIYSFIFYVRRFMTLTFSVRDCLLILLFLVVLCYVIFFTPALDYLSYLFSGAEASNSVRNEQRQYLVNEFSFFGKGLGAVLESGYNRGDEAAYGFELSYENLIHKIGIFSLIPFTVYFLTLLKSYLNILRMKNLQFSACALGCMMYLVPSYGNPMLYSPIVVMLHCMALYWLREERSTKLGNNHVL